VNAVHAGGPWCTVETAVSTVARGGMVVVVDDEDREDEGDLVMAADAVRPEDVAFVVRHTSGVVCVAITEERADELALPLMVARGEEAMGTAFTVTVDAADRARTIGALADPATVPGDLARPGHVFPLRARAGGVLRRAGHTEAAVDLARLAGRAPAGVLCELVASDGSMARRPDLARFAAEHALPMLRIADLVRHRRRTERLVERVATSRLPTRHGEFTAHGFRSLLDGVEHVALVLGDVAGDEPVLVRVHSECLTGDVLGSLRCDCGEQLDAAMALIGAEGRGVVVYLRGHEGRGIGIAHKLRAYGLQDVGHDTVDANLALGLPIDARDHGTGAHVLADLGVTAMRLMTNNPAKYRGLEGYGLAIVERVPLQVASTPANRRYLETKRARLGHALDHAPVADGA
jgi:3,4-dihydroxy 2-butanone 4-phosphate synthase / GTP cyclohydrolase II